MSLATPRRRSSSPIPFVILLGATLSGGCGSELRVSDDVDLQLDFERGGDSGVLHGPYVEGSQVRLFVRDTAARDAMDLRGYTLESSDADVLAIADSEPDGTGLLADADAVGQGVAELHLVDRHGEITLLGEIEVRMPTRAVLHAAAPLFLGRDDVPSAAGDPRVLVDGTATFAVEFFDGATPLYGHGALGASADAGMSTEVVDEHMHERRDWLRVRPDVPGLHEVQLRAAGEAFARVRIQTAQPDAIAELTLRGQDQSRARRDQQLVVIAQASDALGDRIYGAAIDWELAGGPDGEPGDVYRYAYEPAHERPLAASFAGLRGEATIAAR